MTGKRWAKGGGLVVLWLIALAPWALPPKSESSPQAKTGPAEPAPEFVLYGVMIMGEAGGEEAGRIVREKRSALLSEPQLTGGQVWTVPLGALIGPYRLRLIESDHVVLEREGAAVRVSVGAPTVLVAGKDKTSKQAPLAAASRAERQAASRGVAVEASPQVPREVSPRTPREAAELEAVSQVLGLPPDTVQTQLENTNLPWRTFLFVQQLADRTGLSVDQLVDEFQTQGTWGEVARSHDVHPVEISLAAGKLRQTVERQVNQALRASPAR